MDNDPNKIWRDLVIWYIIFVVMLIGFAIWAFCRIQAGNSV